MARAPDLDSAKWIAGVRAALKLTQSAFAQLLQVPGDRDTIAKWEAGTEPSFGYTRRIVVAAPKAFQDKFLGIAAASAGVSDPERMMPSDNSEGEPVHEKESEYIAGMLDDITEKHVRQAAAEACSKAIRELLNPSDLVGEKRPAPGQRR